MSRRKNQLWPGPLTFALAVLLFISMLANLVLALVLFHRAGAPAAISQARPPFPCQAIPIKLILEDPACADKLLRAMNVSNVHILPGGLPPTGLPEQTENRSESSADLPAANSRP